MGKKADSNFKPKKGIEDEESNSISEDFEMTRYKDQVSGKEKNVDMEVDEDSFNSSSSNEDSNSDEDEYSPETSEGDEEEESISVDDENTPKNYKCKKVKNKDLNDDNDDNEKNIKEKKPVREKLKKERKNKSKKGESNIDNIKPKKDKVIKEKKEKKGEKKEIKEKKEKKKKEILDPNFNINQAYFYQNLQVNEKSGILERVKEFFTSNKGNKNSDLMKNECEKLCSKLKSEFSNLTKGQNNINYLIDCVDTVIKISLKDFDKDLLFMLYSNLYKSIQNEFFKYKPTVQECHFFPNVENEIKVANMLRTCKKTLDIAIFALTNDCIGAAITEVFSRGIKVRIIADDECAKFAGGEIYKLAALGIPTKTDNSVRFHMHHKFAVLDNSVVMTGSFNWTTQAVKFNQENILFYECPEIASQYTEAYNKLWNEFTTEISQTKANQLIKEQEEIMKKRVEKSQITKNNKKKLKEEEKQK